MSAKSLCPHHFDVVVIGGGIVGAGIFRDLALHGLRTLIIDKKDFASQTSQKSSKMLHGGIRYLEQFEFQLIWEALHEKNLWLKLAPHLCLETRFFLPVYKQSASPLWKLNIGMYIYDLLSSFQNTPHTLAGKKETLEKIPLLSAKDLIGSGIYYDAIVDDAKLTLENIYDGLVEQNCFAWNYTSLVGLTRKNSIIYLTLKDTFTGLNRTITCDEIVFATGPFTDQLLGSLKSIPWTPVLIPSKGSHLWISKIALPIDDPVVLTPDDGRIIFVIPHGHNVLVGTTEVKPESNFFDIKISQDEINYLLGCLAEFFPDAKISEKDILSTFAGIRPLVKDGNSGDLSKTAREHKTFHPFSNIHIIVGGKLTTFRTMGQEISRIITTRKNLAYSSTKTRQPLRKPSVISPFKPVVLTADIILTSAKTELVKTFEDLLIRRLGIATKSHWIGPLSFDHFFKEILPDLKKVIPTSIEEITQFPG